MLNYNPYSYYPNNAQIQNNSFVSAPNEAYARNYPVAPGNSVGFRDESAPFIYVKTMGFSQLEKPIFEKYRRVTDEDQAEDKLKNEFDLLWAAIEELKSTPKKAPAKRKDDEGGTE